MGTLCILNGQQSSCRQIDGLYYNGVIPWEIRKFEARVIEEHFTQREPVDFWNRAALIAIANGQIPRLADWAKISIFHSYYTINPLCSDCSLEEVWSEYLRWPIPLQAAPLPEPIKHLDRRYVPYSCGTVTQYIYETHRARAFVNATNRGHIFHPGYIVRWLTKLGPVIYSNTLGRGIGLFPGVNVHAGIEVFSELDRSVVMTLIARKVIQQYLTR